MDHSQLRELIRRKCAEVERDDLKAAATWRNLGRSLFRAIASVGLLCLTMACISDVQNPYLLVVLVLMLIGLMFASAFSVFSLLSLWLCVVTIITPSEYRKPVHFISAIALALAYPIAVGDLAWSLRKALLYLESHGFYVIFLGIIGVLYASFGKYQKNESKDFLIYPLRCYVVIVLVSLIASRLLSDYASGPTHVVSYLTIVFASYLGFFIGTTTGTNRDAQETL